MIALEFIFVAQANIRPAITGMIRIFFRIALLEVGLLFIMIILSFTDLLKL